MDDVTTLRDRLAGWYHTRRRRLPWREDPTPYRVWVSEIMLQQTQVQTVLPYFERFLAAFPDVHSLARAEPETVIGLWAGLGYYRRCRNLHRAAREVVDQHAGRIPSTMAGLLSLPGVGRYTAAAIGSVAFGLPEAVLDGNVVRVLSRLVALEQPVDVAAGQKLLWALADELLDPEAPSDHNQAMMELGALVCSPRSPDCPACPLAPHCRAYAAGLPERYPLKKPRKKAVAVLAVGAHVLDPSGRLLLARRPDDALLGGLWELPGGDLDRDAASPKTTLSTHLAQRTGLEAAIGPHLATVDHVFTHRRLTLDIFQVTAHTGQLRPAWYPEAAWIAPDALAALPTSRLTDKVLSALGYADV